MLVEALLSLDNLYGSNDVSLYIPAPVRGNPTVDSLRRLRLGSLDDLRLIDDPDLRLHLSKRKINRRLDDFIRFSWGPNGTPVYIVDHHQFVFYGWCEAVREGRIAPGASLRHYDDHSDTGVVSLEVMNRQTFQRKMWSLGKIVEYIKVLGCWQFIDPARRMGLVDEFIHIAPGNIPFIDNGWFGSRAYPRISMGFYSDEDHAAVFNQGGDKSIGIVDIDLDYFASRHSYPSDEERDIRTMRRDMAYAGVVTLATSPGFIDPERAIELIKKILT